MLSKVRFIIGQSLARLGLCHSRTELENSVSSQTETGSKPNKNIYVKPNVICYIKKWLWYSFTIYKYIGKRLKLNDFFRTERNSSRPENELGNANARSTAQPTQTNCTWHNYFTCWNLMDLYLHISKIRSIRPRPAEVKIQPRPAEVGSQPKTEAKVARPATLKNSRPTQSDTRLYHC